jgi:uncharacterized repeat protein (TIGR03803 family)
MENWLTQSCWVIGSNLNNAFMNSKIKLLTGCLFLAAALQAGAQEPHIVVQPTNQTARASQSVTFWAEVEGDQPMYYQWYFGNAAIAGATTIPLVLTASPQSSGTYHFLVANSYAPAGVTSQEAVLTVDPSATVQPAGQTALLGGAATITAVAAGTPPFAYQWLLDNTPLPGRTSATLTLTNVTWAEAGDYAVAYTNAFGSATSAPAALYVLAELSRIKSFTNSSDGQKPSPPLIEGRDGILYGVSGLGGPDDQGTLFKLAKDGNQFEVVHAFSVSPTDGRQPGGVLLEGADGALYGTTMYGGSANQGTIFKIDKDGTGFSVLHHFAATASDGSVPQAGLIQCSDRLLYGTTSEGGKDGNFGTVFRIATNGTGYEVLHRFEDGGILQFNEGRNPMAPLLEGSDGMLYGTLSSGVESGGSVFRLKKNGSGFFMTGVEGPQAPLIEGSDGALYGSGDHFIFRIRKDLTGLSVLRDYYGINIVYPQSQPMGLVEGPDGVLYGCSQQGGSLGGGTVFKLNKDGNDYRVLHSFTDADGGGANPGGGLLLGSDGAFYTTTSAGGDTGDGSIYKIRTLPLIQLAPRIAGIRMTGTSVVLNGSGGTPGSIYQVLMSPDLSQALGSWTPIATDSFTVTGNFSITLDQTGTPAGSQRFYTIRVQ